MAHRKRTTHRPLVLDKALTGIDGFDEITAGGLPRGRPSLICGTAGCGKTLFAMEFLVRGATKYNEPGVFMAFEETAEDLTRNVASLGFDLDELSRQKKISIDYVHIDRAEIEDTGDYDLEGLFIRLGHAIDTIGAKRVVLDTLEVLFGGLPNEAILRSELRRLFRWLKEKGVTAVVTAERGDGTLTRHGLEEYVADCVVLLDHRIVDQMSTRRLRVVKYRGTLHGTNEYPFLIGEQGIAVLPLSALKLEHGSSLKRVPSGLPKLDAMLGGRGFYEGSSVLVSGTAGSGKSSVAASFVNAACARGERALYFAFEESPAQILRNMKSIGLDLERGVKSGLLQFQANRPTYCGLEMHLVTIHNLVQNFRPAVVVIDPVTNLTNAGNALDVRSMLTRLIDGLKTRRVTAVFTSLTGGSGGTEDSEVGISSLMDTWLLLRNLEHAGERNRGLYVLKSRGMAHSNQIREFLITAQGLDLVEPCLVEGEILTGSARVARQARNQAENLLKKQVVQRRERDLQRNRSRLGAQIGVLQAELHDLQGEASLVERQDELMRVQQAEGVQTLRTLRGVAS